MIKQKAYLETTLKKNSDMRLMLIAEFVKRDILRKGHDTHRIFVIYCRRRVPTASYMLVLAECYRREYTSMDFYHTYRPHTGLKRLWKRFYKQNMYQMRVLRGRRY